MKEAVRRKASLGQTISAVAWSFFGVRRSKDHESDMARLNPVHVIIAGVLGAALFVLVLVLLVRWVISSGVAGA
ncbi:DUF2970 domain-containing protein [Roseateles sp.]|uniref:DUF2970 domain-containing protein n=1 Tax=Roseateles sp. TaxID=1971397 RepID=UPI003BAC0F7F